MQPVTKAQQLRTWTPVQLQSLSDANLSALILGPIYTQVCDILSNFHDLKAFSESHIASKPSVWPSEF